MLLLTMVALLFNFVAVLIGVIDGAVPSKAMTLVFAAIYLVLGIPGAWILWYSRLYLAMRRDGAFSFATFFCTFLVHIAFCAWAAVAPGAPPPPPPASPCMLRVSSSVAAPAVGNLCTLSSWHGCVFGTCMCCVS